MATTNDITDKIKTKVLNLYGGPGTGKSTTAAGVFYEMKQQGLNCEYIQEFAKDKSWEFGDNHKVVPKVFQAQEYIFAQQHFRMRCVADSVDLIITDSPLLLGLVYMPVDFEMFSLCQVIKEAYQIYNNKCIFLNRKKAYNPKGRFQTEDEAIKLDIKLLQMLQSEQITYESVVADKNAVSNICEKLNKGFLNDSN